MRPSRLPTPRGPLPVAPHQPARLGPAAVPMLAVVTILAAMSPSAAAAQDSRGYASTAVQNRIHGGDYELSVFGGILPLDAFEKGATLGAAFTLHFSELVAWEVVNYQHSFTFDTDLREELRNLTDPLAPTPFEVVQDMILTNLLIKPVYWKGAFLNQDLVYGEFMFVLGGGYGFFTRSDRFTLDIGLVNRIYLTEWLSVKLDTRYLMFFRDSVFNFDIQDEVWIALGISAHF